ncbi:hypothetical protein ELG83_10475 [Rhizobium leguminosarum]|uniref:hypothetical protein n=1 Tax=Rhizobium leguminosarum TaxID=384 RepID=UPI001031C86E|nr:hypothetical protein [Rhizobium leguminosarum]MBY5779730.1 hypothetical protein [Rhizobium leguminosarum]TBF94515.1 hypothetical protein ELG83_10475 [Rhizobium leguminosarum]
MEKKTTTVRGLTFDVVVFETMHRDRAGTLFYRAEVFIRNRKDGAQRLVQRTRIPNTGQAIARDVQQRGLRALNSFTVTAA